MRFNDLFEYSEVENAVVDLLTVLSAEGIDTISMDALVAELESQGHDVDEPSLFDEIQKLDMVHNIKDGVVRFPHLVKMQTFNISKILKRTKRSLIKWLESKLRKS